MFARAVNKGFACLSSLEVGVLQSAVNVSWVGGPRDIVHNSQVPKIKLCLWRCRNCISRLNKMKDRRREGKEEREGGFDAKE